MIYEFCDTTDTPKARPLPSEAVCFNGKWLDEEIDGFRTLSVEGREFVDRTVDSYSVGDTDGEFFRSAVLSPRTITVNYQLIAEDAEDFRIKYNQLNRLLREKQVQVIFADEPDKYFVATRSSHADVDAGRNAVSGSISLFCSDPRKYSVEEKTVEYTAESGDISIALDNRGNVACPISYEISCESENGYVGIENGVDYIRFGDPTEADGEDTEKAETLAGLSDLIAGTDGSDNGGAITTESVSGKTWLGKVTGTAENTSWYGGSKTFQLPADSNGEVGAVNFYAYSFHWFQSAAYAQVGMQSLNFLDAEGNSIASIQIAKTGTSNNKCICNHYVNGVVQRGFTFECDNRASKNPFLDSNGHNDIRKIGGTVRMFFNGHYYDYECDDIATAKVTQIRFTVLAYKGKAAMTRNYIGALTFSKNDVADWEDLPNRYSAGDVIIVDGEAGKMYVNGIPRPSDELKGSEYFQADPGENDITVNTSSFATGIKVKTKIREAWV